MLYVDVNIGPEHSERIIVYEGDNAEELARDFVEEFRLNEGMYHRLVTLLQDEIDSVLDRIVEEESGDESGLSANKY